MRRSLRGWTFAAGAASLFVAGAAPAQEAGEVTVVPRLAYLAWDQAAGIQDPVLQGDLCDYPEIGMQCVGAGNNVTAGLSILYDLRSRIRAGVSFEVTRPVSNGTYFSAAELNTPGASRLVFVNQRLTMALFGAVVEVRPVESRLSPFLEGGLGAYVLYLDPAKSNGAERFTDLSLTLGGGIEIPIAAAAGLRLHLRDVILTGWDRERLNAVDPAFENTRFPDLVPAPPDASETLHNLWLSVGFSFRPGGPR